MIKRDISLILGLKQAGLMEDIFVYESTNSRAGIQVKAKAVARSFKISGMYAWRMQALLHSAEGRETMERLKLILNICNGPYQPFII